MPTTAIIDHLLRDPHSPNSDTATNRKASAPASPSLAASFSLAEPIQSLNVDDSITPKASPHTSNEKGSISVTPSVLSTIKNSTDAIAASHQDAANQISDLTDLIDVPADGNCFYWSVALACLLPYLQEGQTFNKMYENLFADDAYHRLSQTQQAINIAQVKNQLQNYVRSGFKPKTLLAEPFNTLVVSTLRTKTSMVYEDNSIEYDKESEFFVNLGELPPFQEYARQKIQQYQQNECALRALDDCINAMKEYQLISFYRTKLDRARQIHKAATCQLSALDLSLKLNIIKNLASTENNIDEKLFQRPAKCNEKITALKNPHLAPLSKFLEALRKELWALRCHEAYELGIAEAMESPPLSMADAATKKNDALAKIESLYSAAKQAQQALLIALATLELSPTEIHQYYMSKPGVFATCPTDAKPPAIVKVAQVNMHITVPVLAENYFFETANASQTIHIECLADQRHYNYRLNKSDLSLLQSNLSQAQPLSIAVASNDQSSLQSSPSQEHPVSTAVVANDERRLWKIYLQFIGKIVLGLSVAPWPILLFVNAINISPTLAIPVLVMSIIILPICAALCIESVLTLRRQLTKPISNSIVSAPERNPLAPVIIDPQPAACSTHSLSSVDNATPNITHCALENKSDGFSP